MDDAAAQLNRDGFIVLDPDVQVLAWAGAAYVRACAITADPAIQAQWLRHGRTWFVGVDALDNGPDGSVGGVPLRGPWTGLVTPPPAWHRAQISVVYPGYPKQDADESDAAHRFRVRRSAAHVDGLHLEEGRRIVREPHAFILGLPLNTSSACPLTIWPGSHAVMRTAFRAQIGDEDPLGQDVTELYKETRRQCFERIEPVKTVLAPGQAIVLDRLVLHGVAPWEDADSAPPEGRMVAYFRPELNQSREWLSG